MQFLLRQYFFIISLGMAHETGVLSFFIWTHCLLHIYMVTLPVRRKGERQLSISPCFYGCSIQSFFSFCIYKKLMLYDPTHKPSLAIIF
jgi:hypothetical protein